MGAGLALGLGMMFAGVASAAPMTMDFDGLTPGTSVHNYYDGGCTTGSTSARRCGGPDYGVVWKGADVQTLPLVAKPSDPNWMGPSEPGPAWFGLDATMNVADGFDTGLYFYYSSPVGGNVSVYSKRNGRGTLLTYIDLAPTGIYCDGGVPCWVQQGLDFTGTAKSVVFASFLGVIGFDNVTIGAAGPVNPVPEPATFGMFGLGALLIGGFAALRRREQQN